MGKIPPKNYGQSPWTLGPLKRADAQRATMSTYPASCGFTIPNNLEIPLQTMHRPSFSLGPFNSTAKICSII